MAHCCLDQRRFGHENYWSRRRARDEAAPGNVSLPKEVPYMNKTTTTGIFKEPVSGRVMLRWQQDAYPMIQRRTRGTDIKTRIGNHTFRATGITAYLKNKGHGATE